MKRLTGSADRSRLRRDDGQRPASPADSLCCVRLRTRLSARPHRTAVCAVAFAGLVAGVAPDAGAVAKKTTTKKKAAAVATAAPTTAPSATTPPAASASGEIKIGFINQEGGASGSWPEAWAAVDAAAKYINDDLGAVGGKKIKLVKCTTDGTAASSQKCAQQMVTENVLYVQGGLDTQSAAWHPILEAADVPIIGGIPLTNADNNSKVGYYPYAGGATTFPGLATYILRYLPNARRVGILANDTAGAAAGIDAVTKLLEARGIEVITVRAPASQSDWLAPFAAVSRTDAVAVLVSTANCIPVAKARNSQSASVPMISVSACFSQNVIDAVGKDGLSGWKVDQKFENPEGTTKDAVVYQRVMKKYAGDKANLLGFAPPSYSNLMTVYTNALKPLGAGVTSASLIAKMKDPAGGKVFMGGRYQCRVAGQPYAAICNYQTSWASVVEGKLVDPTAFVDLSSVIKSLQ